MGGKGSGGARIGAGRKPKKIERRGRKKGEVRIGAGRQPLGDKKRVLVSARVAPSTKNIIQSIMEEQHIGVGVALDRLAEHYIAHKDIDDGCAETSASSLLNNNY